MCQPHRVLRRTLTVPPSTQNSNNVNMEVTDVKITNTKKAIVSSVKKAETNVLNSSTRENVVIKVIDTENRQVVETESHRKKECGNKDNNALKRRKSYESLGVIDGRTFTPVNTTARQRLLKVDILKTT
jgi:hypothetical protein